MKSSAAGCARATDPKQRRVAPSAIAANALPNLIGFCLGGSNPASGLTPRSLDGKRPPRVPFGLPSVNKKRPLRKPDPRDFEPANGGHEGPPANPSSDAVSL